VERGRRDELLDVLEPTGAIVGRQPRSVVHRDGLWHQVFHCLVVRSGPPARVLLQRRRWTSRAFAGLLDLSVTGHLHAGEQPADGVREIREELGLDTGADRLVGLGRRLLVDDGGEGRNREIAHVYLLSDDTPLGQLRLDAGEVAGVVEILVGDLLVMLGDPSAPVPAAELDAAAGTVRPIECRGEELVCPIDSYWVVLATMAERHVAGIGPLGI
jgi:8-oxo-dGTP pyrophosphatase MutT (NUDIX family)